ncbi:MAG: glycerophosphodiester phosphodiesterase [Acidimicrobiia bacterium]|nr:glycerophosphodiester phosphodiesterase [Acidimicrobiia bacterium]
MREYLEAEHPIRMAHRGSRLLWPENTAIAIEGAISLGLKYVETDVRVSVDGVAMLFHDAHLGRTTNATGKIAHWFAEDLEQLDTAYWFEPDLGYPLRGKGSGMLTLVEALQRYPDTYFNIDLKSDTAAWAVSAAIDATGAHDRVLIGSFFDSRLRRFRRVTRNRVASSAGPQETLAMWTASRLGRTLSGAPDAYQVPEVFNGLKVVDRRFVDACHQADKQVHVWTVNGAEAMRRLLDIGVDGIVTDRPDLLNEVLHG